MAQVRRFYFEEGSAARQIYEPLPSREEREIERKKRERAYRRAKEQRKAIAMRQNRLYTIYLCLGVLVFATFFAYYVGIQAKTADHQRKVTALRMEVSEMKADNAAESNRVYAATNLTTVRDVAINQLGMKYAGNDKIVYYSVSDNDYMSQYEDIP